MQELRREALITPAFPRLKSASYKAMQKTLLLFLSIIILLPSVFLTSSCEEYNTDVLGEGFHPLNGIVGDYTHLVYVEYSKGSVRVWGKSADEVSYEAKGARLTLRCQRDSLAFFVYGNAVGDSLHPYDGQLRIEGDHSYALYLSGLRLYSKEGPAIDLQNQSTCFLVIPAKSQNALYDSVYTSGFDADGMYVERDGCLFSRGPLVVDGSGTLSINSVAEPRYDKVLDDSLYVHALYAMGGIACNYSVKMNLYSQYGDGLHVEADDVVIAKGYWDISAGRHGICNTVGGVHLTGGDLTGIAQGQFVATPSQSGLSVTEAACYVASSQPATLDDDGSTQYVFQGKADTLSLQHDSLYSFYKNPASKVKVSGYTSRRDLVAPWLLISSPKFFEGDTLYVVRETVAPAKKK